MAESKKSLYRPSFPKKYKGNPNNIICRSSWETKFCGWCDLKENTGQLRTYVIEVKPLKQTKPPKPKKKVTKSYIYECKTYAMNQAKWKAADEWCKDKRIEFKIITERELGIR